ncbi:MFS transporter [Apilactobacillus apisilvae]|uniref:MFS transporter n=1 Tax=Apilactobacillus apisilvae TaxID=2923364 RepID=A0ABY4PGZ5_9LACO|nr:MFS transporter [Apilactobacillus apisilvae]UQS84774.1 MFS transporter [Apilactobacillus apisilvae]
MAKKMSSKRWWILFCIGIVTFMTDLDASVVNIALPVINKSLSINMSVSELIVSSYLITICILLLPFGKLSDKLGKNKIFKIGVIVFSVGSLLCGMSNQIIFLLVSRVIQAVGAAMTMSTNNGIITEVFPKEERGQALGWIGSFVALGMIAGPGVGGIILQYLSWQYIFWINVPIGVIMIIMSIKLLPNSLIKHKTKSDNFGIFLSMASILGIFIYIYAGQQIGYTNIYLYLILFLSIILFVGLILVERKKENPLINLALFKNRNFSIGLLTATIIFITNNFYMVLTPFYLENARNFSAGSAGLMMMLLPLTQIITSPISGKLSDKIVELNLTIIGLAVIFITQFFLIFSNLSTNIKIYLFAIGLLGLGNSIFQSPNNSMIMSSISQKELGIAGSMNSLSRNIGMVTGNALATSLLFIFMSNLANKHITNFDGNKKLTYMVGQQYVYIIGTILILFALVISIVNFYKNKKISEV